MFVREGDRDRQRVHISTFITINKQTLCSLYRLLGPDRIYFFDCMSGTVLSDLQRENEKEKLIGQACERELPLDIRVDSSQHTTKSVLSHIHAYTGSADFSHCKISFFRSLWLFQVSLHSLNYNCSKLFVPPILCDKHRPVYSLSLSQKYRMKQIHSEQLREKKIVLFYLNFADFSIFGVIRVIFYALLCYTIVFKSGK